MARAVGLDIGSRTIKVVEMGGSAKAPKAVRVVIRDVPDPLSVELEEGVLPPDPDELISEVVREIFNEFRLPKDDVCAAFDAGVTTFREITVPFRDDDQIRKIIRFEAENHLHGKAIEDVIVNWVKTGETKEGSRLTIFASPKEGLARLTRIMKGAGIDAASVDLDATAVFTACDAAGVFQDHPNVLLMDVGARSTALFLVAEGRPVVIRSFLLGTEQVESRLGRDLSLPAKEARQRARITAGPRDDDLLVSVADLTPPDAEGEKSLAQIEGDVVVDERLDFVRKLHRETMRSLSAVQTEAAPERILVCGGGSLLPQLRQALEEKFDLPVEPLDLMERVGGKDLGKGKGAPEQDPEFVAAVTPAAMGCGIRMMGHNPFGIELLREEFAPTNLFDVIKKPLATLVTLAFVALLALAYSATKQRDAEKSRYAYAYSRARSLFIYAEKSYLTKVDNRTEDDARAMAEARFPARPSGPEAGENMRRYLMNRHTKLQQDLGLGAEYPPIPSALEVWLEVVRALERTPRPEYGYLRILGMDIKPTSASVSIAVEDPAAFDKIRENFKASEYLTERSSRALTLGAIRNEGLYQTRTFDFRFKDE